MPFSDAHYSKESNGCDSFPCFDPYDLQISASEGTCSGLDGI